MVYFLTTEISYFYKFSNIIMIYKDKYSIKNCLRYWY